MTRTLVAGFFALAVLPTTAFTADAADGTGAFTRTVGIGCRLNANDGESLKVRMMLTNTSGYHLPQGSKVRIGIRYTNGVSHPRWGRTSVQFHERTLWRDVAANGAIGFDEPSPSARGRKSVSCAASVTFASRLKLDRTMQGQRSRLKLPR